MDDDVEAHELDEAFIVTEAKEISQIVRVILVEINSG